MRPSWDLVVPAGAAPLQRSHSRLQPSSVSVGPFSTASVCQDLATWKQQMLSKSWLAAESLQVALGEKLFACGDCLHELSELSCKHFLNQGFENSQHACPCAGTFRESAQPLIANRRPTLQALNLRLHS